MAPIKRAKKASATTSTAASKRASTSAASAAVSAMAAASADSVNIGAPAQHGQSSRKGKKAWRKNVDVGEVEAALERARGEERVTGGRYTAKTNDQLFTIDTVGDVAVAKRLKKSLRSLAVLSERSAIPSLTSRSRPSASTRAVRPVEKARLRRLARRPAATARFAAPSAEVLDAWAALPPPPAPVGGFGAEAMFTPAVKPPPTLVRAAAIRAQAIAERRDVERPEAGTSYNPAADAHAALIAAAVDEEVRRLAREAKEDARAERMGDVVRRQKEAGERDDGETVVAGMTVGAADAAALDGQDEDGEVEEEERVVKPTKRKTQAQRNKALRAREAARLDALDRQRRRLEKAVASAPGLSKNAETRRRAAEEAERLRRLVRREKERKAYEGGEKVGKHRVAKGRVEVQLGEDLAENLRTVKPEGNLFKDRFLALQKRGLLEPRTRHLPTRRTTRTKEYEKHAYKRFE
ncbi:hypothetical protein Q5752_005377 [Cryptotrichosporon argae]